MSEPMPPRPSPARRPNTSHAFDDDRDEPKTDPGMTLTVGDFKTRIAAEQRTMTIRGWLMAMGSAIFIVAGTVVLVLIFIDNRVQAQTDAGIRVHEERLTTLEQQRKQDREELDGRLKRIETNANDDHQLTLGTSQKVDKLLERFQVPNPAPTPKDGGR